LTDFKYIDPELCRKVDLIEELDQKANEVMDELERATEEFFKTSSKSTEVEKKEKVDKIRVSTLYASHLNNLLY